MTTDTTRLSIVYDGDCPFCTRFVTMVRLQQAAGPVDLVNARDGGPVVQQVTQAGYDLNLGMAMVDGERIYFGADCLHRIALLSTGSGLFNRMVAVIFASDRLSRWIYPMLRGGRNLSLRVLGRPPI